MHINDFDYHLPEELIAQYPSMKRDESRLLVVHRKDGSIEHKKFYDIIDYLKPGDCLVMNDSRVIPARLFGEKADTGAKAEILLIRRLPLNEDQENAEDKTVPDGTVENLDSLKSGEYWEAMVRPGRRLKPGASVVFSSEPGSRLTADILEYGEGGTRKIRFRYDGSFHDRLEECGHIPLPPYIDRPDEALDRQMYQTVYSRAEGSVAAPTAGLHFTEELLDRIRAKGVKTAQVTLHVGIGTFRPVKCEQIEEHHMHFEEYEITQENADIINETKAAGGRVISVGTTSTRTMESAADEYGRLAAGRGSTDIFIYPGYRFRIVDSLITNFHLPKSTLLMLISALYDREKILEIYKEAVENRYAFFSYGDAMFLE